MMEHSYVNLSRKRLITAGVLLLFVGLAVFLFWRNQVHLTAAG